MSNLMRARRPDLVLPAKTLLSRDGGYRAAVPGMERVNLRELGILSGIAGGDRGYHTAGDIITALADGTDLNELWTDYNDMLGEHNARRDTLVNFITWRTTNVSEMLFQSGQTADFEEASEFGEPVGYRPGVTSMTLGYTFKWYDLAARFTWQFLADADQRQVDAVANMAAEADNRNVFMMVLKTLFNNSRRKNKEGNDVFPFYAGAVGDKPNDYGATTFADQHNHYVTSGAATVDAQDFQQLQGLLTEHGYSQANGYNLVAIINEAQEGTIRQFRSEANGGTAGNIYDFVPAQGTPSFLIPIDRQIEPGASRPPATINGIEVVGQYGQFTILKNEWIPTGYVVAFATGGAENVQNPVAIREHPTASLRGLRLVKGRTPDYPLIDSFYNRGFGTGIRYRGAGAVMQITVSGSYTVPAQYAW